MVRKRWHVPNAPNKKDFFLEGYPFLAKGE